MERPGRQFSSTVIAVVLLLCTGDNVWAADFEFTRETYDVILLWVNFLILAGLIVKFARQPVISFLKDKRAEVQQTIQELEDRKRTIEEKIHETQIELDAGQERLALLKEKIITEGQRRKEALIEDAQNESALMMTSAKLKSDALVRDAGDRIRAELIDMAADLALQKLPNMVTDQDHDRFVENWMNALKR